MSGEKRRDKSGVPLTLRSFLAALAFAAVYAVLYWVLSGGTYAKLFHGGAGASVLRVAIVTLAGAGICTLAFIFSEERVPPYGNVFMAALFAAFCVLAYILGASNGHRLFKDALVYGAAPAAFGNALAWRIYHVKKKKRLAKETAADEAARNSAAVAKAAAEHEAAEKAASSGAEQGGNQEKPE